ncbi:MAG: hypothetical protein HC856_09345 [Pseudanabaena sp. RU_4_16]|nr:hypothetical protein [Pseudanabaena sp. RU_4_16]
MQASNGNDSDRVHWTNRLDRFANTVGRYIIANGYRSRRSLLWGAGLHKLLVITYKQGVLFVYIDYLQTCPIRIPNVKT